MLTLALAGASGRLSASADDSGRLAEAVSGQENSTQAENSSGQAEQGASQAEAEAGNAGTAEETIAEGQYTIMGESPVTVQEMAIMGESPVTVQEMVDYFNSSGKEYPSDQLSKGGADSIETFCQMYYEEASAEGVRPEVAFAQTMKETGFLQYGGDASIEQFNFAGLGTTGGGVPGNSYPDVRTGIRAQIQHLKAYATSDPLEQECVDDRYEYVKKGAAPYVEWLGQQENPEGLGWATGDNYGYDIVNMIKDMM